MVADSNGGAGCAVQGQALLPDSNGGLDITRLAVRDGEVEQERGPTSVIEIVGQTACLLEVCQRPFVSTDSRFDRGQGGQHPHLELRLDAEAIADLGEEGRS